MKVIVCEDYEDISAQAADEIAALIRRKPDCVLGLATGSTPEGMYRRLCEYYGAGRLDFSGVTTVNLDEYYPISPENPQSYRFFMNHVLFDRINIRPEHTHIPDGTAEDADAACRDYERTIRTLGGVDLQVLGIGQNGHIGFNEPAEALFPLTHKAVLTENTVCANARFFEHIEDVPRHALTMGMKTILSARRILVLANGKNKASAVATMLSGLVRTSCPASFLNLHADVTLFCDRDALSETELPADALESGEKECVNI